MLNSSLSVTSKTYYIHRDLDRNTLLEYCAACDIFVKQDHFYDTECASLDHYRYFKMGFKIFRRVYQKYNYVRGRNIIPYF